MLALAPPFLVAIWPWLWFDTASRLNDFFFFAFDHEQYPTLFFGRLVASLDDVPRWLASATTAATTPLGVLALASVGAYEALRPTRLQDDAAPSERAFKARSFALLLLIAAALPLLVFSSPGVPVYHGVRLWSPSFPPLVGLTALGAAGVWRQIEPKLGVGSRARWVIGLGLSLAFIAEGAVGAFSVYPWLPAYYNAAIGGPAEAAQRGMQLQYWAYYPSRVLREASSRAERDHASDQGCAKVYIHAMGGPSVVLARQSGLLSPGICAMTAARRSDYALHIEGQPYDADWRRRPEATRLSHPEHSWLLDGVAMVTLSADPAVRLESATAPVASRSSRRVVGAVGSPVEKPEVLLPIQQAPAR